MNQARENAIIGQALQILEDRLSYKVGRTLFTDPESAKSFARLKLAELDHEVFAIMFLDNQHGLIEFKEMFTGTIDGASVYPREVLKYSIAVNAKACIFIHNHPSGISDPSQSDIRLTEKLKETLSLVEIRVLDHLIVGTDITSMAERGLI